MKHTIRIFIKRNCIFLIPFAAILSLYMILDPFKVLRSYENYYPSNTNAYIGFNKDHTSTSTFDRYLKKEKYDSFIFGNSRSIYYEAKDWQKYIGKQSHCFHFDASDESLFGIHQKIIYIQQSSRPIKNALIVFDTAILSQSELQDRSHLYIISPQLVGYSNWVAFHTAFIKAFLTPKFLFSYLDFKISRKAKPYMKKWGIIENTPMDYDVKANEERYGFIEKQISLGTYYTPERQQIFYPRNNVQQYSTACIGTKQKDLLQNMYRIFKENSTKYKIVISPLYDQQKINPKDFEILEEIFGEENVFDFSGINKYTQDYRNYYETSHYRPLVTREILDYIYSENSEKNKPVKP